MNRTLSLMCACIAFFSAQASTAAAPAVPDSREMYSGYIAQVIDGDKFVIRIPAEKTIITAMLLGADAPELKQDTGKMVKYRLMRLIGKKRIDFQIYGEDKDNTVIVRVFFDQNDVSLHFLREGLAWFNADHMVLMPNDLIDQYDTAALKAQQAELGIWKTKWQTPPWEFKSEEDDRIRIKEETRAMLEGKTR